MGILHSVFQAHRTYELSLGGTKRTHINWGTVAKAALNGRHLLFPHNYCLTNQSKKRKGEEVNTDKFYGPLCSIMTKIGFTITFSC